MKMRLPSSALSLENNGAKSTINGDNSAGAVSRGKTSFNEEVFLSLAACHYYSKDQ